MTPWNERVVLITGGTRGIGRALVETFARAGAYVFFTYRGNVERAIDLVSTLTQEGCRVESKQADAAQLDQAQEVVDWVLGEAERLDVVINNAGITRDNLILRMSEEQWDEVLENNLKSVFNYTKAAAKPMMKQRRGVFVNLSSVVGLGGNAGQANYAASKAGVLGFTKSVALELASRKVRANAVAPGFIATEMTADLPEKELAEWTQNIPLGRAGQPEEVAQLCLFLASDEAAYITGQVIRIDGGMQG